MKRWIHLIGITLTLGSFIYFGLYIWRHQAQWPHIEWSAGKAVLVAALMLLHVSVAVGAALAWRQIIGFSGKQVLTPKTAVAIFCKTQFAKYVPGNLAHHLGRLLLVKNEGLSASRATLSQTIELLWNMGCAAVLAVYGLSQLVAQSNPAASYLLQPWVLGLLAAGALLGPVFALPVGIRLLRRYIPSRVSENAEIRIPAVPALFCMVPYLFSFLSMGVAMNCLASALFDLPQLNLGFVSSVCALAWVIGFVTPGSPAGIGIRDMILLLALKPAYGSEAAASAILAHRALTTVGDFLVFLLGVAASRGTATRS